MTKTKFYTLFIAIFCLINSLSSQELAVSLYMEDVNNNLDTVIIGYDSSASDSIDSTFSELDVSDQTLDGFDVRSYAINSYDCFYQELETNFTSEIDIRQNDCEFKEFCIGIPTANLPVTISWDINSQLASCYKTLQITDFYSVYWAPLPVMCNDRCVGDYPMYEHSSTVINENCSETAIVHDQQLALIFIQLIEISSYVDSYQNENIEVYPNPLKNEVYIKSEHPLNSNYNISIYDIHGAVQKLDYIFGSQIDLSHLTSGAYFLQVQSSSRIVYTKLLIKY